MQQLHKVQDYVLHQSNQSQRSVAVVEIATLQDILVECNRDPGLLIERKKKIFEHLQPLFLLVEAYQNNVASQPTRRGFIKGLFALGVSEALGVGASNVAAQVQKVESKNRVYDIFEYGTKRYAAMDDGVYQVSQSFGRVRKVAPHTNLCTNSGSGRSPRQW